MWRSHLLPQQIMVKRQLPLGWDDERIKRLISHDKSLSEEDQVSADECMSGQMGDSRGKHIKLWRAALVP